MSNYEANTKQKRENVEESVSSTGRNVSSSHSNHKKVAGFPGYVSRETSEHEREPFRSLTPPRIPSMHLPYPRKDQPRASFPSNVYSNYDMHRNNRYPILPMATEERNERTMRFGNRSPGYHHPYLYSFHEHNSLLHPRHYRFHEHDNVRPIMQNIPRSPPRVPPAIPPMIPLQPYPNFSSQGYYKFANDTTGQESAKISTKPTAERNSENQIPPPPSGFEKCTDPYLKNEIIHSKKSREENQEDWRTNHRHSGQNITKKKENKKRSRPNEDSGHHSTRKPQKRYSIQTPSSGNQYFEGIKGGRIPLTTNIAREVEAIDPNTGKRVHLFVSCSEAARSKNINRTRMSRICRAGGGQIGGLHFQYVEMKTKGGLETNQKPEGCSSGSSDVDDSSVAIAASALLAL